MSARSYQALIEKKPWYVSWRNARRRCTDIRHKSYPSYGGVGIRFVLKPEECEFLWNRDKAYLMVKPRLDRKNTKQGYSLPNCKFLEEADNLAKRVFKGKKEATTWED